jgi:adsorption protein B
VYPLVTPAAKFVHWTYCDEFAENHTKDLMARQVFSPFIPSAGVGTAYNRWLIEFVGTSFARNMFSRRSLTEDYDIALRLAVGEAKLLYLYRPFGANVATWAYFPQTFSTAVRQRTRWLIGICIQAWQNYGWVGNARLRVTLYRDRKAVITNIINALAYVVLVYVLLYELAEWGLSNYGTLVPLVSKGTPLWYLVLTDTGLMLWRFAHRFMSVSRIYGRRAGLLSIPRLPVSNIVNFAATVRAFVQFFSARHRQKHVEWEKTAHTFPGAPELSATEQQ